MSLFAAVIEVEQTAGADAKNMALAANKAENLNNVDYLIIGVLVVSTLISLVRGFLREILSLLAWVAAVVFASLFSHRLAEMFVKFIDVPSVRLFLAFIIIFVSVLIICGIINFIIASILTKTGLSATDRLLGMFFGAARGALLISIAVFLLSLTPIVQDPWWQHSILLPKFQMIAEWLKGFLPAQVMGSLN